MGSGPEERARELRSEVARRLVHRGLAFVPELRSDPRGWWLDVLEPEPHGSVGNPNLRSVSALVDERPLEIQADHLLGHLPRRRFTSYRSLDPPSVRGRTWCGPE